MKSSLLLFTSFLLLFFGRAPELSSLHELVNQLDFFRGSLSHVLFPSLVYLPLTVLSRFLFHAELLSLGFELEVHCGELQVLIKHLFALSPLSQSVLLENIVVP